MVGIIIYLVIALIVSVVANMVGEADSLESSAIVGIFWIFVVPFVFLVWATGIISDLLDLLKDN